MELSVILTKLKTATLALVLAFVSTTAFGMCRIFIEQLSDGSWVEFEICCWDNQCSVMSVVMHPPTWRPREQEE